MATGTNFREHPFYCGTTIAPHERMEIELKWLYNLKYVAIREKDARERHWIARYLLKCRRNIRKIKLELNK